MKQCIVNVMMLILICCCDHSRHKHNSVCSCQDVISQVITTFFLIISIYIFRIFWEVTWHSVFNRHYGSTMTFWWLYCTWSLGSLCNKSDIPTLPNWVLKHISHVLRPSLHVQVGWTETLKTKLCQIPHWSGHFGHWERLTGCSISVDVTILGWLYTGSRMVANWDVYQCYQQYQQQLHHSWYRHLWNCTE